MSDDRHRADGEPPSLPARLDPRAGRPARRALDEGTGTPTRRQPPRLVAVGRLIAGLLAVVLLGTSGWGWYLGRVVEASVNRTDAIPADGNEDGEGVDGRAMNLLLVGNDSRASATEEQLAELGTEANAGTNTDTMILVHIPANGSAASFVSFPRDSYVDIPGHGQDKLNAAYAYGMADAPEGATDAEKQAAGAQLLIQTISQLTGLAIDHYAEVDLLGFFNLSSVIGGVEVNLCNAVQDSFSGVDLPAGISTIEGTQALAFVRQRHGLPRGDFDRIIRQQYFIAAMIRKMLSENVLLDLGKQRELVEAAANSLTVDQTLNLFDLAAQMQSVSAGSIDFQTIPYVGDSTDDAGRYILELQDEDTLRAFFANLSADSATQTEAPESATPPATVDPSEVSVAVFNGSGISGVAGSAATALTEAGFTVASTGNADSTEYSATEIRYAAGDEALAATVAAQIPGATTAQVDDVAEGTVQLVIGSDFNGIGQALSTPTATTSAAEGEDPRTAADTGCIN